VLAWLGHIVVDWGFANGLRTADGYRRAPWAPKHGRVRGASDRNPVPSVGEVASWATRW
jgi:hypothetical protein